MTFFYDLSQIFLSPLSALHSFSCPSVSCLHESVALRMCLMLVHFNQKERNREAYLFA